MIAATSTPDFDGLIEQIAARIEAQAAADARSREMAARGDPARWRSAELVWPGFAAPPTHWPTRPTPPTKG